MSTTKPKTGLREFTEFDVRVGQAWSQHVRKQDEGAVREFQKLLEEWPDHIDANLGLALSQRALGQASRAADLFRKIITLIKAEMGKGVDETSRFQMLLRLVEQHLVETEKLKA